MYIAIVYGASVVINCAVYKDYDCATAHALQTPPQRQASTVNRIANQTPYLGLAKRDHLKIFTQIPKHPKTPSRPFWSFVAQRGIFGDNLGTVPTQKKQKSPIVADRAFCKSLIYKDFLAEWTGLEPATPGVTGRYSNQLNYHS